ncbi:tripartite tricarboxylate transporter TctB family protein [Streptomyces sp. TRM49041]|uniref:tripartite tricarboxylate transporter TctB family protein n=1 Tax=Streptomyces sp. TRM49041 TaxID=2603216 RepID=UPI0011F07463|nr:tripartite tricarboxylate transporter TctB family protein [Streptomyces sp. TRM49041]
MHHFRFSQRTLAVVLGLVAVAYTVQAYRIPEFTAVQVPVQPGTLPRGLGLLLIVLSVALFFQKPKRQEKEQDERQGQEQQGQGQGQVQGPERQSAPAAARGGTSGRFRDTRLEPAVLLLAICLYVALFVPLGFVISTTLFVVGTAWFLGFTRHWVSALVGGGVALALYLAMSEGLDVALPTGPLPF